tara:strand:+ start:757 stop:945 length:189 start_codon:yes stop_codon:yes gene_type:complete
MLKKKLTKKQVRAKGEKVWTTLYDLLVDKELHGSKSHIPMSVKKLRELFDQAFMFDKLALKN